MTDKKNKKWPLDKTNACTYTEHTKQIGYWFKLRLFEHRSVSRSDVTLKERHTNETGVQIAARCGRRNEREKRTRKQGTQQLLGASKQGAGLCKV